MTSNLSRTPPECFLPGKRTGLPRVLTFITCTLTLLCNAWELHAQTTDLTFELLTVDKGLSSNEVTAIMQDSRGFMWFGTANGLNKYDGYSFTTYKYAPLDSASLSGPWINLLYEDTHGDIWITTGGLNRFDRASGKISRHLSDRHITSICEDSSADAREKGMWFTTLGLGVYQYNRTSNRFTEYRNNPNDSNSISSDSTFCASVDIEGTLWIGTAKGLNSLDKSRRKFTHLDHGPKGDVYTIYQDPDEPSRLLWIGANDGLYVYDKASDSFSHYRNNFGNPNGPEDTRDSFSQYWNGLGNPNRPEDNDVRTVYHDRRGRLWVGMFAKGLNGGLGGIARFDRSTRLFTSYQGGLYGNAWGNVGQPWTICEERTGTMWMVFSHWGYLRKYDEMRNEWTPVHINADHDVPFRALCEDRSGTMWFGTVADGVRKLDRARKQFSIYTRIPGDTSSLSSTVVTGICEDASGSVWVGTMGGLNRLDVSTGKFTHYLHDNRKPHSLSVDRIWPVLEDRKGRLWIGTWGGGLDEFDRSRQRFVHHRNRPGDFLSLPWEGVDALCESRDGTLWVGTDDASISEYAPGSNIFHRHLPDYGKSGGTGYLVDAILEDHAGLIWIAVPGAGVYSYDRTSDTWTRYMLDPITGDGSKNVGHTDPFALCEDRHGTIWVGTDVGLFRVDRHTNTCVPVSAKEDLPDNFIRAILEDGNGCLWLCTLNGLSRFTPQTGLFRNYDASDGVTIGPCQLPTGYKNKKGEMFFGGSNGLVRFHPDSIRDNPYVPPVVITAFKKFDKLVPLDSAISEKHSIEMSYKENVFSFEFAALNYTSPEKNQYAYKLEGFDADWVYCGTRRYATYTNLDGGSYTFRVKGSNNDGIWNEEGTSIAVVITPPFWATWWFRVFALVAVFGSVAGSVRYIEIRKMKRRIELLEQERALEQERSRISQDMHDEVGASLTEIAILSELAQKEMGGESDIAGSHIRKIADRSREVVDSISEIIWTINPKNDHLNDLIAYLHHYAVQFLKSTAIRCRFESPETVEDFSLSAEVRRHIFLVVKEALHNVVKHSGATETTVRCGLSGGTMEVSVEDNGKGFPVDQISRFGNGVPGMRKRIENIGGTFTLDSHRGGGTRVCISVPVAVPPV
jgi:signal transduction histidine kinase/ligand-binding sensor domain-containing protein